MAKNVTLFVTWLQRQSISPKEKVAGYLAFIATTNEGRPFAMVSDIKVMQAVGIDSIKEMTALFQEVGAIPGKMRFKDRMACGYFLDGAREHVNGGHLNDEQVNTEVRPPSGPPSGPVSEPWPEALSSPPMGEAARIATFHPPEAKPAAALVDEARSLARSATLPPGETSLP